MSRWADSFQQHQFQIILREFSAKLNSYTLAKGADANVIGEYSRLRKVVKYIQSINSSIDPELISPHILNEMQGNLQASYNEFNAYISNFNVGHLQNANNNIDHVLGIISRAFVFYKKPAGNVLSEIVKTYSDALSEHQTDYKKHVASELADLTNKANEIKTNMESVDTSAKQVREDLKTTQQQVQTQLAEFNTQFQNSQAANQQKSDESIAASSRKSDEQRNVQQKKFDEMHKKAQTNIEELFKASEKQIDDEFSSLVIKAGSIIGILEKFKIDAEAVFGVVQNTVQAGAHKSYADAERKIANTHRLFAVALMLLSVAILIVPELIHLFKDKDYVIEWAKILYRLPLSIILFAPAFYLARESNKHRQNEFQNRRRELTLRTIDPYLALLKDEKQRDELKGQIAKGIFANDDAPPSAEEGDVGTHLVSLLDTVAKMLNKKMGA